MPVEKLACPLLLLVNLVMLSMQREDCLLVCGKYIMYLSSPIQNIICLILFDAKLRVFSSNKKSMKKAEFVTSFERVICFEGLPGGPDSKESSCNAGNLGSMPELGRSSGGRNGYSLQYSCLENPMDKGAWWAGPWCRRELDTTEHACT